MRTERNITICDLPLSEYQYLPPIESVILRFPDGVTIDIGSLCYLDRDESKEFSDGESRRRMRSGRKVNVHSINADRISAVHSLLRNIAYEFSYSSNRAKTVYTLVSRFMPFMDWADKHELHEVLSDLNQAKLAFKSYILHLRERVNMNSISVNSAYVQQRNVQRMFEGLFSDDFFSNGCNLIKRSASAECPTTPPDEKSQAQILQLCDSLFESLSSFIIDFKPYPHRVPVPSFLNYPNDCFWIFPRLVWFKNPNDNDELSCAYNYKEGRVFSFCEMKNSGKNLKRSDGSIREGITNAKYYINLANTDVNNPHRIQCGRFAVRNFILLFLAETGMNWSQIVNLTWTDDYQIESTRQRFVTVKWRANGKEVSFEIQSSFLNKFKRFLIIRKYILQNKECKLLFFENFWSDDFEPYKIKYTPAHIYISLKRIYPDLVKIGARQWRAAKSDWLIRNTDPSTTALILQNTEKTTLKSYTAGSETSQIEELSTFLNKLSKTVLSKTEIVDGAKIQSLGICTDYGAPILTSNCAGFESNCEDLGGCLFCEKFKVHADELDTRKLISCRHCVQQILTFNHGSSHHEKSLVSALERINYILLEISNHDANLVERITREVEEFGELEQYWARKFEMLMELELIK